MATYENRSRYFVQVTKRRDLYKEFPYDQEDAVEAYIAQLKAQNFSPKLDQLEDKIFVRVRTTGFKPQQVTVGSWAEAEGIAAKIKEERISAFLSGKGMGLARAAELNGYPGPGHVLELASQLDLTPEQRTKTEALRDSMESKAIPLGRALVEEERKLDRLFATKAVNLELLASSLSEIGALQAQMRGTHLEAHLAQAQILTPEQTARYAQLRGYSGSDAHEGHGSQHKH
jgi:Spy/CpxP family protein refolding chaperone